MWKCRQQQSEYFYKCHSKLGHYDKSNYKYKYCIIGEYLIFHYDFNFNLHFESAKQKHCFKRVNIGHNFFLLFLLIPIIIEYINSHYKHTSLKQDDLLFINDWGHNEARSKTDRHNWRGQSIRQRCGAAINAQLDAASRDAVDWDTRMTMILCC